MTLIEHLAYLGGALCCIYSMVSLHKVKKLLEDIKEENARHERTYEQTKAEVDFTNWKMQTAYGVLLDIQLKIPIEYYNDIRHVQEVLKMDMPDASKLIEQK